MGPGTEGSICSTSHLTPPGGPFHWEGQISLPADAKGTGSHRAPAYNGQQWVAEVGMETIHGQSERESEKEGGRGCVK